jgi:hypothetical protein
MAKKPQKDDNQRTPAETAKVRDATLKRMLATKPQRKTGKKVK